VKIETFNLGDYAVPEDARGGVCVDIGANVGSFLEKHAAKFSKVHFYEPIEQCFNICKSKTKDLPCVTGFMEAVYHTPDLSLRLVEHANHEAGSVGLETDSLNADWTKDVVGTVVTVDLPRVLERAGGHVDYMKIDCETSEYHFLVDQDLSRIKYIGIEIHWQMGEAKYRRFVEHLLKTHIASSDILTYAYGHKEVLCTRKQEA